MSVLQNLSDIVCDIKEKLTDLEYKSIMDELQTLNNTKLVKTDDDVKLLMHNFLFEQFSFFVQQYYHSSKNNKQFVCVYTEQDGILTCRHLSSIKQLKKGDEIVYKKDFDNNTVSSTVKKCIIDKIMPKYTILKFDDYEKKISNITLCKILYYPYIRSDIFYEPIR